MAHEIRSTSRADYAIKAETDLRVKCRQFVLAHHNGLLHMLSLGRVIEPMLNLQLGPRLELEVVKAEEGLCSGQVLFHAHVQKPPEAAAAQHAAVQDREELRAKRRAQQVWGRVS